MNRTYTARYDRVPSGGYMGQLVEWPAVITEGATLEECRFMLADAVKEMILAYKEQNMQIPEAFEIVDRIPVEA